MWVEVWESAWGEWEVCLGVGGGEGSCGKTEEVWGRWGEVYCVGKCVGMWR